jgi:molecular chaperone DnaK
LDRSPLSYAASANTKYYGLVIGRAARNQWLLAPQRTIRSIKRKMGQAVKVRLGDAEYTPQEISAMILRTLRDRAARALDTAVKKAVITVPAYFNDAQRQATREAGELAGLEVVRILNEPTAASLTYEVGESGLKRVLVYDLGGGTFDVSIVQMEDGVVEVLSSHGDTQLGGDDFDQLLAEHLMKRFEEEQKLDLRKNPIAHARVFRAAEEAKKKLSYEPFAIVQEEFIAEHKGKSIHLNIELTRSEFEELIRPLLEKTIVCVGKALDDANLTPAQIDKVLLVGGSTRSPIVSELLEERLGQRPHQEVHPDLCVALGAGIQGAMIAGLDAGPVLVDITPHSLGVSCIGEVNGLPSRYMFSPIIPRNTALPASRSEVYLTVADGQEAVHVEVYQGEHNDVRRNTLVGDFRIEGLAKVPAGNEIVTLMTLTLDGVLKVSATEKRSGLQKQVRIENALTRFQRDEHDQARRRIDELFEAQEPQESDLATVDADASDSDMECLESRAADIAESSSALEGKSTAPTTASVASDYSATAPSDSGLSDSLVQANALMERGKRLLPNASPEDRAEVERRIARLRSAVAQRRVAELQAKTTELADLLFYLEEATAE